MSNQQHPAWEFIKKSPKTTEEQMFLEALYVVTTHPRFMNMTVEGCWEELAKRAGQKNVCNPEIQIVEKDGRRTDEHGSPVWL